MPMNVLFYYHQITFTRARRDAQMSACHVTSMSSLVRYQQVLCLDWCYMLSPFLPDTPSFFSFLFLAFVHLSHKKLLKMPKLSDSGAVVDGRDMEQQFLVLLWSLHGVCRRNRSTATFDIFCHESSSLGNETTGLQSAWKYTISRKARTLEAWNKSQYSKNWSSFCYRKEGREEIGTVPHKSLSNMRLLKNVLWGHLAKQGGKAWSKNYALQHNISVYL